MFLDIFAFDVRYFVSLEIVFLLLLKIIKQFLRENVIYTSKKYFFQIIYVVVIYYLINISLAGLIIDYYNYNHKAER